MKSKNGVVGHALQRVEPRKSENLNALHAGDGLGEAFWELVHQHAHLGQTNLFSNCLYGGIAELPVKSEVQPTERASAHLPSKNRPAPPTAPGDKPPDKPPNLSPLNQALPFNTPSTACRLNQGSVRSRQGARGWGAGTGTPHEPLSLKRHAQHNLANTKLVHIEDQLHPLSLPASTEYM